MLVQKRAVLLFFSAFTPFSVNKTNYDESNLSLVFLYLFSDHRQYATFFFIRIAVAVHSRDS